MIALNLSGEANHAPGRLTDYATGGETLNGL